MFPRNLHEETMKIRNPINKRTLEQSSTHVHRGPAIGHAEVGEQAEQQPRQQAEGEPSSVVDCLTRLEGAVRDGFRVTNDRFNSIDESLAVVLPVSITSDRSSCYGPQSSLRPHFAFPSSSLCSCLCLCLIILF